MDSSAGIHQGLASRPVRPSARTAASAARAQTQADRAAVRAGLAVAIARVGLAAPLFGGRGFSCIHALKDRSTRAG